VLHLRQMKYYATVNMSEQEFVQYIQAHQRIIHKICHVYAADAADREDLFQEILMQAWRAAPQFKYAAQFSTWLYRIGLNTAIAHFRKTGLQLRFTNIDTATLQLPESTADRSAELEALYTAIGELGKVDKAIMMLWLDDFDYNAIGEMLGISPNNVAVKMLRIREKLKSTVKKHL
jgi:RNA polymerase sigma factor (sigma-70 family)